MKGCDSGNTGQGLDVPQCFGPGSLQDNNVADNCRATREIDEDVGLVDQLAADHGNTLGGVLSALPGCNPIQPGPGKATKQTCGGIVAPPVAIPAPVTKPKATSVSPVANTTPAAASKKPTSTAAAQKPTSAATSPSQAPSTGGTAAGVTIPVGWNYLGCYSDNLNPRSLGKQGVWYGQPITSSNCIAHCKSIGMTLAGTENGGQCFCGNELKQSKPTPGKCTTPCSANTHEMCGGSGTLSVFKSSGKSKPRHRHRRSAHGFAIAS